MVHIDAGYVRAELLQTVKQTAQSPSPLAIGTVSSQLWIEAIEGMLATVMVGSPLTIVVHLFFVESHDGNRTVGKELAGQ